MNREKSLYIFSMVGGLMSSILLILQFKRIVSIPLAIPVAGVIVYPLYRVFYVKDRPLSDVIYLIFTFAALGGVFAYSSQYPVGYADVHKHLFASEVLINDGKIQEIPQSLSVGFIGLYIMADVTSQLLKLDLHNFARFFPVFSIILSTISFHTFISRKTLSPQNALFASLIFGLNWGVFRFSVEYRTINLAFPLIILLIAILFRYYKGVVDPARIFLMFLIISITASITHFTTYLFFLVISLAFMVTSMIEGRYIPETNQDSIIVPVLFSAAIFITYLIYIGGSFQSLISISSSQILQLLFGADVGGESARGVVGNRFGAVIFVLRWVIRAIFIFSFVAFTYRWWVKQTKYGLVLILMSVFLGLPLFLAGVVGIVLNPSRIFIYFAIPYSIIIVSGSYYIGSMNGMTLFSFSSSQKKAIQCSLIIIVLMCSLFTTPFKFPQSNVGDTEPVRGFKPIDSKEFATINEKEISAKDFTNNFGLTYSRLGYDTNYQATMRIFFTKADLYRSFPDPDPDVVITYDSNHRRCFGQIYSNGELGMCRIV